MTVRKVTPHDLHAIAEQTLAEHGIPSTEDTRIAFYVGLKRGHEQGMTEALAISIELGDASDGAVVQ